MLYRLINIRPFVNPITNNQMKLNWFLVFKLDAQNVGLFY
jgi:hypothetical protein